MVRDPDSSLINDDIKPAGAKERKWSVLNMASLWVGMVICVPSYTLAGGLVDQGMSWKQAVFTVMLGNLIVLVPMVLNGHPGTKYGIPFPVLARASFGIHGAHIPSLLRALVACGWFGINTWFGGEAIYGLLNALPWIDISGADLAFFGINAGELSCFVVFWALQLVIIYKGVETIKVFETAAAPFLILMSAVLLIWAYVKADGFGPMLSAPSQFDPGGAKEGQFWSTFFPSLTAMVGFWATLSLNIPDFTRYAKDQRSQIMGQAIGLPLTMTFFAFIGVAVTSASVVIFGEKIPDPVQLVSRIGQGSEGAGGIISVCLALFALSVATLSTNIAANVVSPANAMINVRPKKITFRIGGFITAGLGLVMFPWKLLESSGDYLFVWLVGYSALLGPIGGILVADYFLLRKTRFHLDDLFKLRGRYLYMGGFNPIAVVALVLAVLPSLPGFLEKIHVVESVPAFFSQLYTYAWFVGFLLGGGLYFAGMKATGGLSSQPGSESEPYVEEADEEKEEASAAESDESDAAEAGEAESDSEDEV